MTIPRLLGSFTTACALATLFLLPRWLIAQAVAEGFPSPMNARRPTGHVLIFETSGSRSLRACADTRHFIGEFAVSVRLDSGRRVTTPLNPMMGGRSLRFPVPGETLASIVFDDYNGDGRPDFALTELGCGTLVGYYLFTIAESGRVRPLPLEGGGPIGMSGDPSSISDLIPMSSEGLVAPIYNNFVGKGEAVIYRWNVSRARFEFARRVVGKRLDVDRSGIE